MDAQHRLDLGDMIEGALHPPHIAANVGIAVVDDPEWNLPLTQSRREGRQIAHGQVRPGDIGVQERQPFATRLAVVVRPLDELGDARAIGLDHLDVAYLQVREDPAHGGDAGRDLAGDFNGGQPAAARIDVAVVEGLVHRHIVEFAAGATDPLQDGFGLTGAAIGFSGWPAGGRPYQGADLQG